MNTSELQQLVDRFLIHHYGTNEPKTLRGEFGVGSKVVNAQTVEMVQHVPVEKSVNHWLFDDLVNDFNEFLAQVAPGVEASLMLYFSVRVHHKHTDVRARARVA